MGIETVVEEAQNCLAEMGFLEANVRIEVLSESDFKREEERRVKGDMSVSGCAKRILINRRKDLQRRAGLTTVGFYTREARGGVIQPILYLNGVLNIDEELVLPVIMHELAHAWASNTPALREITTILDQQNLLEEAYGIAARIIEEAFKAEFLFPRKLNVSCKLTDQVDEELLTAEKSHKMASLLVRINERDRGRALRIVTEKIINPAIQNMLRVYEVQGGKADEQLLSMMGITLSKYEKLEARVKPVQRATLYFHEGFATYVERVRTPGRTRVQRPAQQDFETSFREPYEHGVLFFDAIGGPKSVREVILSSPSLEAFYGNFQNHETVPVYRKRRGLGRVVQQRRARAWMRQLAV